MKILQNQFQSENEKQDHNFERFFDFFKFPLKQMSLNLWKNANLLTKQPSHFQVVGRIFNKKYKSSYLYLIKYKYFESSKDLLWVNIGYFTYHPAQKVLKQFDELHPKTQNLLIHKKFAENRKQIVSQFKRSVNQKHLKILGKAKIGRMVFYLATLEQNILQNLQWNNLIQRRYYPTKLPHFNMKFVEINHNLKDQPFIDKEGIKKIIINELQQKNDSKAQILNDQYVDKLVDEKIKMFIEKFHQLKKQVQDYCQGVSLFDSETDQISVLEVKQKLQIKPQQAEEELSNQFKSFMPTHQQLQKDNFLEFDLQENEDEKHHKKSNKTKKQQNPQANSQKQTVFTLLKRTKKIMSNHNLS